MMTHLAIHAVLSCLFTFSPISLCSSGILLVIGLCVQLCTHVSGGRGGTWCLIPHAPLPVLAPDPTVPPSADRSDQAQKWWV